MTKNKCDGCTFFYHQLLADPTCLQNIQLYFTSSYEYACCLLNWSFRQWVGLLSKHPTLMFSVGSFFILTGDKNFFTPAGLKMFRQNEDLFSVWILNNCVSDDQWKQIDKRLPQYSHYRLIVI